MRDSRSNWHVRIQNWKRRKRKRLISRQLWRRRTPISRQLWKRRGLISRQLWKRKRLV
jgi:hypothetical protein